MLRFSETSLSDTPRKRLPLRWLSLAEIVGVVAVVVAVLGYWDSHRERTQEAREKALANQARCEGS